MNNFYFHYHGGVAPSHTNGAYNTNEFSSQQVNSRHLNLQPHAQQFNMQQLNPQQLVPRRDSQLQGLPTNMGLWPQGSVPQGPNDCFQGMYSHPHQPQQLGPRYYPSFRTEAALGSQAVDWTEARVHHAWELEQRQWMLPPVRPVLPLPLALPYCQPQQYGRSVELGVPQSGGPNQLGHQLPVQPIQSQTQTISLENDGVENPAAPRSTAAGCEPTNVTAPADATKCALSRALWLNEYFEVTALIKAKKWNDKPLENLREMLAKAVEYWPGEYDCSVQRWYLHKENPTRYYCRNRWNDDVKFGWLIRNDIEKLEKSVAEEKRSLLAAPINGAAPVNNKPPKRSMASDSHADSEPAAKRARTTNQTSAAQPSSKAAPAKAAPKNARRKSSAQAAPKKTGKKPSAQAATPRAGPRAFGESETSSKPKAPRARRNKKSGTEVVAGLPSVSAQTSAEPSGKAEMSATSPAPVAEAVVSQTSTEPCGKESRAVEIAMAEEETAEPPQEQTGVLVEKEGAVEEALLAKDAKPEDEDLAADLGSALTDYFENEDSDKATEDEESSHEPTNDVFLPIDEESTNDVFLPIDEESTNDVFLPVDEESEVSEEE